MRKLHPLRLVVVAALAGSAGLAVALPSGIAAAKKGPVTATCTGLFGGASQQVLTGCTANSSKVSANGLSIVTTSGTSGTSTIYWNDGKTTIESFTYVLTPGSGACPTFEGTAANDVVTENVTVTGGSAKLTTGQTGTGTACVYLSGGSIYEQGLGSTSF
jgi:hypothetical protein